MKLKCFKQRGISSLGQSGFFILILIFAILISIGVIWSVWAAAQKAGPINPLAILQTIYATSGLWLILLGLGVFLIIFGMTMIQVMPYRRWLYQSAQAGMVLVSLSLLVVIVTAILPLVMTKPLTIEECKQLVDTQNAYRTMACIFVGYAPTEQATVVTQLNFIITAIVCPFAFFYYMFKDMIEFIKFPSNANAQNVIAFIGSYCALRWFLASYFVEFFTYGWFGMGVLVFGVFMLMMAWALIKKYFMAVIEPANMQNLFAMLSGRTHLMPRALLSYIANHPAPYAFLSGNLPTIQNLFTAAGLLPLFTQVQAILTAANAMSPAPAPDRDNHVRTQLANLAASLPP